MEVDVTYNGFYDNEELKLALRVYQWGMLAEARDHFAKILQGGSRNPYADYFHAKLCRELQPPKPGWRLHWRISRSMWETQWLDDMMADAKNEGLLLQDWNDEPHANLIVIDNQLTREKEGFYRQLSIAGHRIVLIHLSDEAFEDDCSLYKWTEAVFRTFWSPRLASLRDVHVFALGYKTGLRNDQAAIMPASERPYSWFFAGDPNKHTRPDMLRHMGSIEHGNVHVISGFDSADSLDTAQYADRLSKAQFVPCPGGFVNLDTFRVYEALELGAIPIVERRWKFDYFKILFPDHPFLALDHWSQVHDLLAPYRSPPEVNKLQAACQDWWTSYKSSLRKRFSDVLRNACSGIAATAPP